MTTFIVIWASIAVATAAGVFFIIFPSKEKQRSEEQRDKFIAAILDEYGKKAQKEQIETEDEYWKRIHKLRRMKEK